MSPMERTLKELRKENKVCGIVERFVHNNHVPHRSDLFNIFDVLAMDRVTKKLIGVQVCGEDFASHYRKITESYGENAILWLNCGGQIEIWGWRKLLMRKGLKRKTWQPRVKKITYDDFRGIYEPRFEAVS